MKESYMSNCFIKLRDGDIDIISGCIDREKIVDVTVRLNRYAIVPIEEYEKLRAISEKAV